MDISSLLAHDFTMLIAYSAILLMALFPIWIGAHRSLNQKSVDKLTSQDAYMFPVMGSCVLLGLYLLFKFLNKDYINMLLTLYFLVFGVLAVAATLRPTIFRLVSGAHAKDTPTYDWTFTIPFQKEPTELKWSMVDLYALIVGLVIGTWYVLTKHWVSNNVLGIAFSVQGVSLLSLGSFQVGCILLGGLFLYDIFWVFGTDVMVTVAKSFDAPIKLLWPKDIFGAQSQFSMLGLGDIVIPGIFIALMLRLDAQRARSTQGKKVKGSNSVFDKPFFTFTYTGYILGMMTTIAVMHIFQAAQPALLYLVPFCLGSSVLCGMLLGETSTLILYSEEEVKKPAGAVDEAALAAKASKVKSRGNKYKKGMHAGKKAAKKVAKAEQQQNDENVASPAVGEKTTKSVVNRKIQKPARIQSGNLIH